MERVLVLGIDDPFPGAGKRAVEITQATATGLMLGGFVVGLASIVAAAPIIVASIALHANRHRVYVRSARGRARRVPRAPDLAWLERMPLRVPLRVRGRLRVRDSGPAWKRTEYQLHVRDGTLRTRGKARYILFHDIIADLDLVDDSGSAELDLAHAALLATPPGLTVPLDAQRWGAVGALPLPEAVMASWRNVHAIRVRELVLADGQAVEVAGSLSRVADVTAEALPRDLPTRPAIHAGAGQVLIWPA